ncbi:MAG: hypothetical protein C4297_04520 [Gemmataceae bacterium]
MSSPTETTSGFSRFIVSQSKTILFLTVCLCLAGVLSAIRTPSSVFPQTDFPRVVILIDNGVMPGDLMMANITRPVEEAMKDIPGVVSVRSATGRGSAEVNVFFNWSVDMQKSELYVNSRLAQIRSTLPATATTNVQRLTFSAFPVVGLSLTSTGGRSQADLWQTARYDLKPRLLRVPGVARVNLVGGRAPEYHVRVDPFKLEGYHLALSQISDALLKNNLIGQAGLRDEDRQLYLTVVDARTKTAADIAEIVIAQSESGPVRIKDVAEVLPGEEPQFNIVTADGKRAVLLNVRSQPDGSTVGIADGVEEVVTQLRKDLPPDMRVAVFYDQSLLVRESVGSVWESILFGLLLSVAIMVGFLKSGQRWLTTFSTAAIAVVVIPVTVLAALVAMKLLGMSFNLMTLGGIAAIGHLERASAREIVDVRGLVVAPGFIDAHVHGDLVLLADPYHEPAVRQGVTTYIVGQDGVAMAPGRPETIAYMRRYTAGFSGLWDVPTTWSTLDEYLQLVDRRCSINVACLVPNGNVRMDVIGLDERVPTTEELERMRQLVRQAIEEGAVGLSSGLDYIPSLYADTEELIALCRELARYGGVYVTHMRRYDPDGLAEALGEVRRIAQEAAVPVHISHFNSRAELALPLIEEMRRDGLDVTFDIYPYLAGSTILGMVALPPEMQAGGTEATLGRLRASDARQRVAQWLAASPRGPLDDVRLSFVADPSRRHLEGATLAEAAAQEKKDLAEFICDLLFSSALAVGCIVPHRQRSEEDVRAFMRHPAMMGGSDGIFAGGHPHPRGWGSFARFIGPYVREGVWSLEQAVAHLSAHPARRFGLKDRGLIREGMAADLVIFDPQRVTDRATYDHGRCMAEGVDSVLVNGQWVLRHGQRTSLCPGRALRRSSC